MSSEERLAAALSAAIDSAIVRPAVDSDDLAELRELSQIASRLHGLPSDRARSAILSRLQEELAMTTATTSQQGLLGYYTFYEPDPARASHFFSDLFGWKVNVSEDAGEVHANVENSGKAFGFNNNSTSPSPTLMYTVRDIERVAQRVIELGGQAGPVMHYRSGGNCECTDNQGVRFDLFEPAEGYAPEEQPAGARGVAGLGYYVIWVPEPVRASDFYSPLFGWEFEPQGAGMHTNSSNVPFGFHPSTERLGPQLWYRVERIAEMRARVLELGGTAGEITSSPAGLSCDCADDQGVEFAIWEAAPGY